MVEEEEKELMCRLMMFSLQPDCHRFLAMFCRGELSRLEYGCSGLMSASNQAANSSINNSSTNQPRQCNAMQPLIRGRQ
jgi:hypothetical protein